MRYGISDRFENGWKSATVNRDYLPNTARWTIPDKRVKAGEWGASPPQSHEVFLCGSLITNRMIFVTLIRNRTMTVVMYILRLGASDTSSFCSMYYFEKYVIRQV